MAHKRETWTWRNDFMAECTDCDWSLYHAKNAQGLAAQHHDRTGHRVRWGYYQAGYYGRHPGQFEPGVPEVVDGQDALL